GLIDLPVIGLPVSTGYGHGAAGEGALTTMLQSCSTGLTVVNIDSGVGAGAAAVLIAARAGQGRRRGTTTATMATTTAATSIKPNRAAATPRETSAPPGSAKTSPKRSIAARTATSSHGKPRRRRPSKKSHNQLGRFCGSLIPGRAPRGGVGWWQRLWPGVRTC